MSKKREKQSPFEKGIATEVHRELEKKGIEMNLRKIQRILAGQAKNENNVLKIALRLTKKRLLAKQQVFKDLVVLKLTTKTK